MGNTKQNIMVLGDPFYEKNFGEAELKISNILLNTFDDIKKIFDGAYSYYNQDLILDKNAGLDLLYYEECKKPNKLEIGKYTTENLLKYLLNKNSLKGRDIEFGFDCIDFVNFLRGQPIIKSDGKYNQKGIRIESLKDVNVGDVLVLFDLKKDKDKIMGLNGTHHILYLGEGLFISKFGQSDIFVTTLEEIKKLYKTDLIEKKYNLYIQGKINSNTDLKHYDGIKILK